MSYIFKDTEQVRVTSENVKYSDDHIEAKFDYNTTQVKVTKSGEVTAKPLTVCMEFKTERKVPKTGVMLVGWGGNNGTTVTAGILANQQKLSWRTKEKVQEANYYGSVTQASTIRLGLDEENNDYFVPFKSLVPLLEPNNITLGGWDISKMNLGDAMKRAQVLDVGLQDQIYDQMKQLVPLPSIYCPDFIAANQADRADNVLEGTKQEQLDQIMRDIEDFKQANELEKVIILWTANTERFCDVSQGLNSTSAELLQSIKDNKDEVSPSTIFAVASILKGCAYINGSPQNTFVPGVVDLANQKGVYIGGDDFKSGQTKMKSVLVDFLVSSGIKPVSIVSYNHLGNNDGKNLSAPKQFRSKEISKSNVVDDMVASNGLLFKENEHPDHCVVIKYVPYVGDSKRALDEYTSEIFMGGKNTIAMHNTCEDSLLATPLIIDLVIITELFQRVSFKIEGKSEKYEKMNSILSLLSFLLKAPLVPENTPVVNALFPQRQAITNFLRACIGLQPENHMNVEHRINRD